MKTGTHESGRLLGSRFHGNDDDLRISLTMYEDDSIARAEPPELSASLRRGELELYRLDLKRMQVELDRIFVHQHLFAGVLHQVGLVCGSHSRIELHFYITR